MTTLSREEDTMSPSKAQLLWMYEKMVEIRYYEETMAKV